MEPFSQVELQLAARNHGMPLEALRYPVTPAGLHYLLTHYDIPAVDAGRFELTVGGHVARPLAFSLGDLRARPALELEVTMECAGNGRALLPAPRPLSQPWLNEAVGTAAWRGTPLAPLLAEAGPLDDAVEVVFTGLDRGVEAGETQDFERSLPLEEALREDVLLAYEMNGAPLLPQHGFPLRLVVPGWYGMASVKWLTRITLVDRPFEGHQQAHAYRFSRDRSDPGTALSRIAPRALMVPPGLPDFPTRERTMRARPVHDRGPRVVGPRAGRRRSTFDRRRRELGRSRARRAPTLPWAWRGWRYEWNATSGAHVLCCRARDEAGNVQPDEADWNVGGYVNNSVQRVPVTVGG